METVRALPLVAGTFCGSPRRPSRDLPVRNTPSSLTLGTPLERVDAGAFTVTRSAYGAGQRLPSHAHELASATMVLRGSVVERVAGRRLECRDDRFLVRPAAVLHENVYGDLGAECVIVGARAEWVASDRVARGVFGTPSLATAGTPLAIARRMRRELGVGDDAATLAIEGLALELIAAAARQLHAPRVQSAPAWLRAVRERLHDDYAKGIRLHVMAREAGVHPVHLTRAFRQCFGCSPGEYARQRRIDRACAELAESDRPIAAIALDAGFSSPSHFATAFRRTTSMTPRDYRTAAQRGTRA
jgi:AraC family transcriptional regulator